MENTINDTELQKIIKRLKDEKSKLEEEYKSRGSEEEFIWAKSAPIDEIQNRQALQGSLPRC